MVDNGPTTTTTSSALSTEGAGASGSATASSSSASIGLLSGASTAIRVNGVVTTTNGSTSGNGSSKNVDHTSVRVALRIRPSLPRELINGCQICTSVTPGVPQVWIGTQHAFTYDAVFDTTAEQESVFEEFRGLIDGCLEGYNATILAYGQTGSGKTYTMGTGFDFENIDSGASLMHGGGIAQSQGIVPRAVHYLFESIRKRQSGDGTYKPTFKVSVQFIELYNEDIIDLVDGQQSNKVRRKDGPPGSANQVKIHEDSNGGIYLVGVETRVVHSAEETMKCLRLGALGRTTASTNMNDQSSRSHAIFSIHIEQQRLIGTDQVSVKGTPDYETLTAKFHFVDLAGSERLKRTGAVGERQKEGISINCGLLALGNVISALGDKSKKASHVPYRDSKLTRLLQDSLGGNSRTVMIACVSPCDVDFVETLNTLKYANRARNIKNKVTINQDKTSRIIAELKDRIKELEEELLEFRQGKRLVDPVTGEESFVRTEESEFPVSVSRSRPTSKSDEDNDESEDDDEGGTTADESDTEENESYSQLTALNIDITTKEKLIEELEGVQTKLEVMRQKYEEKIACLATKINATESERDKLLKSHQSQPSADKIKVEYEKKLSDMQSEMKKWKQAHRDNQLIIKKEAAKQKQIESLKTEVERMKQTKVKLMNQIKAESVKFRTVDSARNKEIAQLKKEQRKKDNAILKLTSEKNARDGILKRKHEEINYLKNKLRPRVAPSSANKFSPLKAKQKWASLKMILIKTMKEEQAMETYEAEMMKAMENRQKLKLDQEERHQALLTIKNLDERNKVIDELDSIRQSLTYTDEKIKELQGQVLTSNREELDVDFEEQVQKLNKEECTYLMKKMYEHSRENLGNVRLFEKRVALLEMENRKLTGDLGIIRDLYHHLYTNYSNRQSDGNGHGIDEFLAPECLEGLGPSSNRLTHGSNSGSYSSYNNSTNNQNAINEKSKKARRLTSSSSELLGTSAKPSNGFPVISESIPNDSTFVNPNDIPFLGRRNERRAQSMREAKSSNSTSSTPIPDPPAYNRDIRRNTYVIDSSDLPIPIHAASDGEVESVNGNGISSDLNRTFVTCQIEANYEDVEQMKDVDSNFLPDTSFLASPTPQHKQRQGSPQAAPKSTSSSTSIANNVFQRLTSQTTVEENVPRGSIKPLRPNSRGVIYNSHMAEGHTKAVLSIYATETRLYTGGKDAIVKIWDLNNRVEVQTLQGHFGNINAIQCSADENLIFTASLHYIKMWDRRMSGTKCLKMLISSGIEVHETPMQLTGSIYPMGETLIQALSISNNTLFSTYGERVRAWDIRKSSSYGLLKGIHSSSVMCLAAQEGDKSRSILVTGSKDHRIKVYDFRSNESIISTPVKYNLEPPHYDGIQSLALSNGILFSGSRDNCIKKWDVSGSNENCLVQNINNAHTSWITGLAFTPSNDKYLLSTSRDGFMKLWSVDNNCSEVDKFDVKGKGVECIATNSKLIFTGSSNGELKFWKLSESRLSSYMFYLRTTPVKRGRLRANARNDDIMSMSTGGMLQLSL